MSQKIHPPAGHAPADALRDLIPALRWLDERLTQAAAKVPEVYGPHVVGDRYRGLYLTRADADQALARPPAATFGLAGQSDPDSAGSRRDALVPDTRLRRLADAHGLSEFDIDVVLLALAPELDRRYERLYAYLQDDVSRRRPSVDLALQLFARDAAERLILRGRFAPDEPLLRDRLISLAHDPGAASATLLARDIRLDDQIVDFLLGQATLDRRLAAICWYEDRPAGSPDQTAVEPAVILGLAHHVGATGRGTILRFKGDVGSGTRAAAAALARAVGAPLLVVDLEAAANAADPALIATLAVREAGLRGAVCYVSGADLLASDARRSLREAIVGKTAWAPRAIILAEREEAPELAPEAPLVVFGRLSLERRLALWRRGIAEHALDVPEGGVDELAARFDLTPRQIELAATHVRAHELVADSTRLASPEEPVQSHLSQLFASARRLSGARLASLATRIEPVHDWDELVLPDDARAELRELCDRVAHRHRVMTEWGFGERLSRGKGVNALFSGAPGTGKTMAAEVLARELGVDLFRVELAGVVSKYIGETEKNLDRIFAAADHANAVLLFDEADALFGKRSEVQDAHDRYANIEISYLLQRMEEYEGVAILATNLRGNLDAAFLRRLAFTVHFPFPDGESRRRIWERVWPRGVPVGPDVAIDLLASRFTISGGHIRNIALAAAFLAAADGGEVTMEHVLKAARREYQKLGKTLTDAELAPFVAAKSAARE